MINAIVIDEINPMSSAPRDGTTILLADRNAGTKKIEFVDAFWNQREESWELSCIDHFKDDEFEGWIPMIVYKNDL